MKDTAMDRSNDNETSFRHDEDIYVRCSGDAVYVSQYPKLN